jgi:S-formylglutathione hydrolase
MSVERTSSAKCFGGDVVQYRHFSNELQCNVNFRVFFPPQQIKAPILYFLSGLTCTDENFAVKAGAFRYAANTGVAIIMPDTSPRGDDVPKGDSWDFGQGAGFYVDAIQEPYKKNYRMYSYITKELPSVLASADFHDKLDFDRQSIFGHSMGGHGALTIFLKNPGKYKSVSAFAPICHPSDSKCQWGQKAFKGYLGDDQSTWKEYDATVLLKSYKGPEIEILIDQGTKDNFLPQNQLQPEAFEQVAKERNYPVTVRMQEGYDHGYFFISTFVEDHINFHAKHLK